MPLAMTTAAGHTPQDIADLQRLLAQHEAEIARQSAELQARDLLIEQLKLDLPSKSGGTFDSVSLSGGPNGQFPTTRFYR